jgi:predicted N-formylglutamate amidohydrolase
VLVEIRQDLIADERGVDEWTARLLSALAIVSLPPLPSRSSPAHGQRARLVEV